MAGTFAFCFNAENVIRNDMNVKIANGMSHTLGKDTFRVLNTDKRKLLHSTAILNVHMLSCKDTAYIHTFGLLQINETFLQ